MYVVIFTIFAAFMALELPLLVIRKLFPQTESVLPLGGDEFNQVAILLMMALFCAHVVLFAYYIVKATRRLRNTGHSKPTHQTG
jgi:hypothetical protein